MSGLVHRAQAQRVIPFGSTQVVSGTTVLLAFTHLGDFEELLFTVVNLGVGALTITLDSSQDLVNADASFSESRALAPATAESFLLRDPEPQMRYYFKLSSSGASSVRWEVRGRPRM